MKREERVPRPDWPQKVEALGFHFHSMDGVYWDERACYRFTAAQVDRLELATAELQTRCIEAAGRVIESGDFGRFHIPEPFHKLIRDSWDDDEKSLFGRFDLSWDGNGDPKMLEYNADTPTALLEASVVQWYWLQDSFPKADQFNSIHEKLVDRWKELSADVPGHKRVHFTCVADSPEDQGNVDYLRDTAIQAGLDAKAIDIADIGWNGKRFTDLDERNIDVLFKLYPWEWLVAEEFGNHLLARTTRVIEPAWKMVLSNKAILPVLWEMFPDHPNLLAASFDSGRFATDFVKKPLYSREGANVSIRSGERLIEAPGEYGAEGFIWQAFHELPRFGENYTVIGSWIIGEEPAGIGIREDTSPITRNSSRFVPHYFV
ncbi:glutathionylspermidine synthase family protein [Usitatibacter palustris]|uniref:Acid--amine ligase YgiC n=1 Tax=Usitatibacter palustris TaxID=2732487 RepID=A0A6M4H9J9_9PROT|nr:glutathionylspermidine synthase family protein [Usitatibacter palustris]QJR16429.1 Putative acid--amine ligase YgiC [Usitatibacter palustris]